MRRLASSDNVRHPDEMLCSTTPRLTRGAMTCLRFIWSGILIHEPLLGEERDK
jgi:hypothetical protein